MYGLYSIRMVSSYRSDIGINPKIMTQIRQSYGDYTTQHRRFEEQQASWEESELDKT